MSGCQVMVILRITQECAALNMISYSSEETHYDLEALLFSLLLLLLLLRSRPHELSWCSPPPLVPTGLSGVPQQNPPAEGPDQM